MAKSLTETAGAVLRNQALNESLPDVPSKPDPDRGANSSNPNMATLKPKSKTSEGRFANPNSKAPNTAEVQDLGPALVTPTGESGPAKAGKVTTKAPKRRADKEGGDTSARKLSEDEDFEISEELEAFIDELVAEGLDEDEIAEADYVVNHIRNIERDNPEVGFGNFAILYRTNAQSRAFEDVLVKWGVPYRVVGGRAGSKESLGAAVEVPEGG